MEATHTNQTEGNSMKAKDMVIGEIYVIHGSKGRGRLLMVHDIKKCWYDKNGNAKTYTVENSEGDFSEINLINDTTGEEI